MHRLIFTLALLVIASLIAHAQHDVEIDLFQHLDKEAYLVTNGNILKEGSKIKTFVTDFHSANGEISAYTKAYGVEVHAQLEYEIGRLETGQGSFSVMFLKKKNGGVPRIELLIIYKVEENESQASAIDRRREDWMELCNAHKASELVNQLYAPDALYYNKGNLLEGREALVAEYSYMNRPDYSLTLTKKHLTFVTSEIAYEIGRCSGSYPHPYMILWEKQKEGTWQVLLDSNY